MSQRYFGRPLAHRDDGSLLGLVCGMVAILAGVLVAAAIDPDVLGEEAWPIVVSLLAVPALTALLLGGYDAWKLLRGIRAAEAAGSVTLAGPAASPARPRLADELSPMLLFGAVAAGISLAGGAALCIVMSALIAGRAAGTTVTSAIVRRRERRLGRRYYRTVGEPEKMVWLPASGLD